MQDAPGPRWRSARLPHAAAMALVVVGVAIRPAEGQPGRATVISNVTVFDGTAAGPRPGRSVLIRGARIVEVAAAESLAVPRGAQVIDGRGRFLIPGLWDLHVHQALRPWVDRPWEDNARYFHALLLAHGVTGVRDMAGDLATLVQWRAEIASGERLGPRQVVTGQKMGVAPVVPGAPMPVRTPADVDSAVRMLARGGADFVKIDGLPATLLPALRDITRAVGLRFTGHVAIDASVIESARLGHHSIEHLFGVLETASSQEDRIRRLAQQPKAPFLDRLVDYVTKRGLPTTEERGASTLDPRRLDSMARVLASTGTAIVPTLRLNGIRFSVPDSALLPPPDSLLIRAAPPHTGPWVFTPAAAGSKAQLVWKPYCAVVRQFQDAGVRVLPGSDAPTLYAVPGRSLIEELQMLVRCGLSPSEALRSATSSAAAFLRLEHETGTIQPGRRADLVLLDADPTRDIGNLRQVRAVVAGGRVLGRPQLDSLIRVAVGTARANRGALRE